MEETKKIVKPRGKTLELDSIKKIIRNGNYTV